YQPEEMATWAAFQEMPEEVWAWYLYRRGICRGAEPNAAHRALAAAERRRGERFLLVTQNVDGSCAVRGSASQPRCRCRRGSTWLGARADRSPSASFKR
ncbi:MAG: RNA polymerase subunit sigma, partial [Deltaproteobacteria bacterium]|nr:RNA polymerase subunit sigma [Deltaproteobacteria bacterium]